MIDRIPTSWYGPPALRRLRLPLRRALPTGSLASTVTILTIFIWASVVALTVTMSGCGPIEYINQVGVKAAGAVSAAKLAQADRYAPYEYTAAEEYLHKAREEAAYAEYEDAIEFGRKAEEMANKGRAIAVAKLSQSAGASSSATPASEASAPPASEASPPGPVKQRSDDQ